MAVRAILLACPLLALGVYGNDDTLSLLQTHVEHSHDEEQRSSPHAADQIVNQPIRSMSSRLHGRHLGGASGIVRLLDFSKAEVVFNNLGGQGPYKTLSTGEPAPQEIRYRNLVNGKAVDLKIVADPGYTAFNAKRNGLLQGNGQVNALSGTSAGLQFTFVEEGTNTPHVMPMFYMTFSDIDERHGGTEKEKIVVDSFDKYYTNDDLKLEDPNYIANGHQPTFMSSDYGNYEDNNLSPDSPEAVMLSHAVTYLFTNKSSFHATFTIEATKNFKKGRNVLFSGISQLVFCQEPSTYFHFEQAIVTVNNLGGQGPMVGVADEIRYNGIANASDGTVLDLIVTADETYGYRPSNVSQNGRHGDFGIVNLYCGPTRSASEVYLTFSIVRTGTNIPFEVNAFALTVFDFDSGLHEQQIEYIDMRPTTPGFNVAGSGYASYIVTSTTELDITDVASDSSGCADYCHDEITSLKNEGLFQGPEDEICDPREGECGGCPACQKGNGQTLKRFSATKHGTEADNPGTSQMLAREVADKSVVFTFRSTSTFTMTLGITPTGFNSGRNFMFAGQDMYLMCD
jgi:hypothetical protein